MSSSVKIRYSVDDFTDQKVEIDNKDVTRAIKSIETYIDATELPTTTLTLQTNSITIDIERSNLLIKDIIIPEPLKKAIYEFLKEIYETPTSPSQKPMIEGTPE
jgi:hypothetical protein